MIKLFLKDLKLFFKDRKSVLLTFLLPIILITLFAFAFGGIGGGSSDANPIKLLIVDLDKTSTSGKIIAELDSFETLNLLKMDLEKAKSQVSKGNYPAALVLHKGYEEASNNGDDLPIELLYDQAREMEVGLLQPVLISTFMKSAGKKSVTKNIEGYFADNFPDLDPSISQDIISDANGEGENDAAFNMDFDLSMTSIVGVKKETNLGLIQAVAGTAILMLLFSVAGLGASILEEKESGTLNRLLYSPMNPNTILFGKMLSTFVLALLQLVIMFLFSWLILGLDLFVNIPALICMIIATAFAVSSFGVFLAAIAKSRQQAQGFSTLIILVMSAIGGSMVPLFIMPPIMKKIAVFSVNYWGIQGFYDIFWRNLPFVEILPRVGVLLIIGVVMSLISLRLFRKNVVNLV